MRTKKTIYDSAYLAFVADLADLRHQRGLSQVEFAKMIGRPQSLVSAVESGSRRLDVLEYVVWINYLGFDPKDLIVELDLRLQRQHSSIFKPQDLSSSKRNRKPSGLR